MRLDTLAPAAGHLAHMPAHIYARIGDHAAAARANEAGARADREYFKTASADTFYGLAYFIHNLHFLADSEMMRGRLAAARRAATEVAEKLAPHDADDADGRIDDHHEDIGAAALRPPRGDSRAARRRQRTARWNWRGGTSPGVWRLLARARRTRRRKSAPNSRTHRRRCRRARCSAAPASHPRRQF